MAIKTYVVTDREGNERVRKSERDYKFAVIVWRDPKPAAGCTDGKPYVSQVNWCARYDLACSQQNSAYRAGAKPGDVEIKQATIKPPKVKPEARKIKVRFSSVDGCSWAKSFTSLAGAQKAAQAYVGTGPEIGSNYAVSGDGIGKVQVTGATLAEIFPAKEG